MNRALRPGGTTRRAEGQHHGSNDAGADDDAADADADADANDGVDRRIYLADPTDSVLR